MSITRWFNKLPQKYLHFALCAVFALFALATYNYTGAYGDLGEYLNNPLRVLNGQMPYRDFWLLFPPGEVMLPALLYKVFGLNINVLLLFLAVVHVLIGLMAFVLGKRIFGENIGAVLLALLVFFLGVNHVYMLLLLVATMFLVERRDFWVGVFVGLAFYFRFFVVGTAALAFFITVFLRGGWRGLLRFVLGALLALLVVYLPLYDLWPKMIREFVFESLDHGIAMNLPYFVEAKMRLIDFKHSFELGDPFRVIIEFAKAGVVILIYALPFLVAFMGVFFLARKGVERDDKEFVLFFLVWGVGAFLKALGRSDVSHLAHSVTPMLFLLVFFVMSKSWKYLATGVALLLLVQLPVDLWAETQKLLQPSYVVQTEHGRLIFDDEERAVSTQRVLDKILRDTSIGDYIFVDYWDASPIYALTNRQNPTYYDSLIDFVSRPSEERGRVLCDRLLKVMPKLVVHNSQWMFDGKEEFKFANAAPILVECVEENFELLDEWGDYQIYASY